jgi:hypothetical protein
VGNAARFGGNVSVLEPDPLASAFVFVFVLISPSSTSSVSKSIMVRYDITLYEMCIVDGETDLDSRKWV